ncbi:MAG: hypothetical protein SNJ69_09005 [Chloroflexaceae bacterium]
MLAIIGTVVAVLAFRQQLADSTSSDQSQATLVAIMDAQLEVQREIATVQSEPVQVGPSATSLAERQSQLFATQEALVQLRAQVEATATAVAARPVGASGGGATQSAPELPAEVICPGELGLGQIATCTIEGAAEVDSYRLTLATNDLLIIRAMRTSGTFAPQVALADEAGNIVCQASDNRFVVIDPCAITTSGTHTLTVVDYRSTATGDYRLFVQRLNQAGLAQTLSFGVGGVGQIGAVGDLVSYQFDGAVNDQLLLRVIKDSGAFAPLVSVHGPFGAQVCEASDKTLVSMSCSLTESGSYSLFIDDYYRRGTGTYRILIQRLNSPGSPAIITVGRTAEGALDGVGEFDTFTLNGTAGETFTLTLTRTSGAFAPRLIVYDPAGTKICDGSDNASAVLARCAFRVNGMHTLIVDDYYVRQVGGYSLRADRATP